MKREIVRPASAPVAAEPEAAARSRADATKELTKGRQHRSLWGDAVRRFLQHRLATAGASIFVVLVVLTAIGPMLYNVSTQDIDFAASMKAPSATHLFGTDDLGHDILARVLWGGRISIAVGLAAMLVSITLGTLVGSVAGFFGRTVDIVLMRITDVFISIPQLPLLLLIIYLFRDNLTKRLGTSTGIFLLLVAVIGGLNWMATARLVRAGFLSVKEKEYILAARSIGVRNTRQMVVHILPNVLSPVLVAATLAVGSAIIAESTLSFLGLGFPPDVPTWGRLLFDAQNYLNLAPWMAIFPGLMIFLAVLSINYVGDGLRDALDPHRTL